MEFLSKYGIEAPRLWPGCAVHSDGPYCVVSICCPEQPRAWLYEEEAAAKLKLRTLDEHPKGMQAIR
jgi:hypothetical protein